MQQQVHKINFRGLDTDGVSSMFLASFYQMLLLSRVSNSYDFIIANVTVIVLGVDACWDPEFITR